MTPEISEQVSKAWNHYIKLSPADRNSYLEQLHVEDTELALAVESLLEQQREVTGEYLQIPSSREQETETEETVDPVEGGESHRDYETIDDETSTELPTLSGYQMLDVLGQGGMGIVYQARDLKLNRLVAIKMLRAKPDGSTSELDRFRIEAEAVARLQHPNIVQIHEIGEQDGLSYFSLEYCAGGSLHDQLDGTPWKPKDAAALVETLALAMQAAHEARIIHRDLKPQNVLLGGQSETHLIPKITDFGLAKKLDVEEGMTHSGVVMGTPSYMAPEQARGIPAMIGPAADTYALGAILYQLLTGRPPFKAASMWDTIEQLLHEEPVSPRRLNTRVPKDLETIALKCLQKDPARRYASVRELGEDLKRFIQGEPIVARAISPLERGWRWCVRRPAVAMLLATVVLITIVGFGLVSWQWQRAVANWKESERQRKYRDLNFNKAMTAVDKMLIRVGSETLINVPGMSQIRRELLQDALTFYQGFLAEKSDDPDVIAETARAYLRIGDIQIMLEKRSEGEKACREGVELYREIHEQFPERPQFREGLADAQVELATHYYEVENYNEAESLLKDAIALNEALLKEFPEVVEHKFDLGEAQKTLGAVLRFTGREKEAVGHFRSALGVYDSLEEKAFDSRRCRQQRASCLYALSAVLRNLGESKNADQQLLESIRIQESLVKDFPGHTTYRATLAQFYQWLADAHQRSGQLKEARRLLMKTITTFEKLIADFPLIPDYRFNLSNTYYHLAVLHARIGETAAVERYFSIQRDLLEKLVLESPGRVDIRHRLGMTSHNLGVFNHRAGRMKEAVSYYRQGLEQRRILAKNHPDSPQYRTDVAKSCSYLAQALPEDQHTEALGLLQESVQLYEALVSESPENPEYKHQLAQSYRTLGDRLMDQHPKQAEQHLNNAVNMYRKLISRFPDNYRYRSFLVSTVDSLAHFHNKLDQTLEAEKYFREAVAVLKKLVEVDPIV